jgi:hypothetical protein
MPRYFLSRLTWNLDSSILSLPLSLRLQVCTTVPSCCLRWESHEHFAWADVEPGSMSHFVFFFFPPIAFKISLPLRFHRNISKCGFYLSQFYYMLCVRLVPVIRSEQSEPLSLQMFHFLLSLLYCSERELTEFKPQCCQPTTIKTTPSPTKQRGN